MLLSLIVIVLLGLIAFYHYTQGLFAATVSAFCAAVAAFMAFSYHESVIASYTTGQLGAYGAGVALCVIFAVIYLVLRFLIDNFMPGNVRYPVALDKVGAAVMGVIAGFFATAVVTLAAQELPFGPSIAMYSPYTVEDTAVAPDRMMSRMYGIETGDDVWNRGELQIDSFDTPEARDERRSLWLPVDEWFLGMVSYLSDTGSLAGANDFEAVYPDFKEAMFGHRLGIQRSATQVAVNLGEEQQVTVSGLFEVTTEGENPQFPGGVPQVDGDLRGSSRGLPDSLTPAAGNRLVVVRVQFDADMADRGGYVRFSPASARLVIDGEQYYPTGTLDSATILVNNKPDDYLLAQSGADLVYELPEETIENGRLVEPAFLEFKRYGRVDLGGKAIEGPVPPSPQTHVLRKRVVKQWISQRLRTGEGNPTSIAEFEQMRERVPANAAAAPATDQPAQQQQPGTTGTPGEDEPAGMMGIIRDRSSERNDQIEGGAPQP